VWHNVSSAVNASAFAYEIAYAISADLSQAEASMTDAERDAIEHDINNCIFFINPNVCVVHQQREKER
jgi:hypothetical protein